MHGPFIGEFLGTLTLIIFGGGVCANVSLTHSKGFNGGWITIATGWFVGVVFGVFVAQSAGSMQADINPAVTLAKTVLGLYNFPHMLLLMLTQILGAFTGAIIVYLVYLPHWHQTSDETTKRMVFCTGPAIRQYPSNLITEILATMVLIIGMAAIAGHATQGNLKNGMGPYIVGILVWGIGLSLGGPTGYAINPARDLGPRLAYAILPIKNKGGADWAYAWIPILGPLLGSALATFIWKWIFQW